MFETDVFYDSDCLSCFLAIRGCEILQKLLLDAPLLKYNLNHVNHKFKKLNDYLGFSEVGGYARLLPQMLRKFNSTYLTQGSFEEDLLSMDSVDLLHGHRKNKTRQAYKDNSDFL